MKPDKLNTFIEMEHISAEIKHYGGNNVLVCSSGIQNNKSNYWISITLPLPIYLQNKNFIERLSKLFNLADSVLIANSDKGIQFTYNIGVATNE